ncbi:hypothetical protein N866_04280 [Actinotalea ferrariae CF5-4]|uniref:DoxX family protein n=1 Tax=Actinotalea ferrariae CF5-4 TaxID=948458 RepID=A0A021VSB2_9CELL|nr:hypothetical protein [Actinotalea ferrariae]EYR62920.1 hypothetical protein N866_04280 [Actinotalea ferrariae CF5-4]
MTSSCPAPGPTRFRASIVRLGTTLFLAGGLALVAAPASAHERWFAEPADGGDWAFFASPPALGAALAVVVVAVVWRLAAARLPRPELPFLAPLGRLAPYVPRLLAVHLGVALLALAVTGSFLSPAVPLEDVPGGALAGVVEAVIGIWLVTGVRLRAAAVGVALLGPFALLAAGPVAVLENAAILGIAAFLAVVPPSDGTFGRVDPSPERLRVAVLLLKSLVAVTLVTLAFSEKFTNPGLARNTLEAYPELDVLALVGVQVPVDTFVVVAGAVELLFGLLVLSGALPQVATLVAMVPFNATLLLFGTTEVIGHLPVYGLFLTLLVYGSNPVTAPAVAWLPSRAELGGLAGRLRGGDRVEPAPVGTPAA